MEPLSIAMTPNLFRLSAKRRDRLLDGGAACAHRRRSTQPPFQAAARRAGDRDGTDDYLAALGRLAPYLERACFRSLTPCRSREPRTMW